MKKLYQKTISANEKLIYKDIAPDGGRIENETATAKESWIDRVKKFLGGFANETEKQNELRDEVKTSLESLKPSSLLKTKITAKKRDTLGALVMGVDRAATAKYRKDNNIEDNVILNKEQNAEKEININWGTKVEFYDDRGTTTLSKANILSPGEVVSFRKDGDETVIVVGKKIEEVTVNEGEQDTSKEEIVDNNDNDNEDKAEGENSEELKTVETMSEPEINKIYKNLNKKIFNGATREVRKNTNTVFISNTGETMMPPHYLHVDTTPAYGSISLDLSFSKNGETYELTNNGKSAIFTVSEKVKINSSGKLELIN